jgi:probable rRNA maturation factor
VQKKTSGIVVDFTGDCDLFEVDLARLKRMATGTIRHASIRNASFTVSITDDKGITAINKKYLGHKGSTDVISFDLSDEKGPRVFDITVNAQCAARQACKRGHSGESELALYVIHGLLHCLGYDDLKAKDAAAMHAREDEILEAHGYGRTYA